MSSALRNFLKFSLILIGCLQPCCGRPHNIFSSLSMPNIRTAMERVADYGYELLGYEQQPQPYHDNFDVPDKPTLWDGHIGIPDFVSPLLNNMDTYSYGDERVVKGVDTRLGFRVAIPYMGDIQYVREVGPGRFTDKLGPGKYVYPGPDERPTTAPPTSYHHQPKDEYETIPFEQKYQGLQNYPWNY